MSNKVEYLGNITVMGMTFAYVVKNGKYSMHEVKTDLLGNECIDMNGDELKLDDMEADLYAVPFQMVELKLLSTIIMEQIDILEKRQYEMENEDLGNVYNRLVDIHYNMLNRIRKQFKQQNHDNQSS